MKALTICQPYAELIVRGEKRVENRTWPTSHRGLMYIHAGKSREWMDDGDDVLYPNMPFGAIVAVCNLVTCLNYDHPQSWQRDYAWVGEHEHAGGPWCWVLSDVHPVKPLLWRGAQGLWECEAVTESLTSREPEAHG